MSKALELAKECGAWSSKNVSLKEDYLRACRTIAAMHCAAVGEVTGPKRGVVEDVADIRTQLINTQTSLEREQMRLAACGVVAMADTPDSAAKARDMHPDYRSASSDDVARRVDECIALRAELDDCKAALTALTTAKEYKETVGKTAAYEVMKTAAWKQAYKALEPKVKS